jgi:ribonuclease Z
MAAVKPRLGVGYHSVLSPQNTAAIMDEVRKTYDGPLALARDLMVINVTKEKITVRMAVVDEYVLPPDVTKEYITAARSGQKKSSEYVISGKWKDYTPPPMPERK